MFHVELLPHIIIRSCPVCGSGNIEKRFSCTDHFLTGEDFNINACADCKVLITSPQPQKETIGSYYQSEQYVSHSDTKKGLINKLYHLVRDISVRRKYRLISRHKSKGAILDIGCGTGYLLNRFKQKGWMTKGIEPETGAREFAVSSFNLDVDDETALEQLSQSSFDVISMWHVLEHVHDVNDRMKRMLSLLKQDGVAIVALPNHASYDAKVYGAHWAAWDVPRHLYHFNQTAFKNLLEATGFELIATYPMRFDAYYVSMLSENYKNGKKNLAKALFNGFISNLRAAGNGEYSSVIYLLKKASENSKDMNNSISENQNSKTAEHLMRCTRPCR